MAARPTVSVGCPSKKLLNNLGSEPFGSLPRPALSATGGSKRKSGRFKYRNFQLCLVGNGTKPPIKAAVKPFSFLG